MLTKTNDKNLILPNNTTESGRNYGIDLLRIVSMFMIVILHILGQGGVLKNTTPHSAAYNISWFMETTAFCSVNCYALISGFVGNTSKFKYHSIISLWFQVLFYTVGITAAFAVFFPETLNTIAVLRAIIPIGIRGEENYWYFTAYFCMFFFIPYMNKLVNTLEKRDMTKLIISFISLFCIIPTVLVSDVFKTKDGYSALWLAVLYMLGAYIRKYELNKNKSILKCAVIFLCCVTVSWLSKLFIEIYIPGKYFPTDWLIKYTSPTILAAAISLLILFSNLKPGKKTAAVIAFFAPLTFSVYLIHTHPLVWGRVMFERFTAFAEYGPALLSAAVLMTAFAIWLAASLADLVRHYLFKILNIKKLSIKIEETIAKAISAVCKKIRKDTY